jgi:hypothetical protein
MRKNPQAESILHVNKMIELAHDFFVPKLIRIIRGRDTMAKTVKKAPARKAAKKTTARKAVRKPAARKPAARKTAARKPAARKPAAKKRRAA